MTVCPYQEGRSYNDGGDHSEGDAGVTDPLVGLAFFHGLAADHAPQSPAERNWQLHLCVVWEVFAIRLLRTVGFGLDGGEAVCDVAGISPADTGDVDVARRTGFGSLSASFQSL